MVTSRVGGKELVVKGWGGKRMGEGGRGRQTDGQRQTRQREGKRDREREREREREDGGVTLEMARCDPTLPP